MVQLVAHDLAKVELAGSSPVYRSKMLSDQHFFIQYDQREASHAFGDCWGKTTKKDVGEDDQEND